MARKTLEKHENKIQQIFKSGIFRNLARVIVSNTTMPRAGGFRERATQPRGGSERGRARRRRPSGSAGQRPKTKNKNKPTYCENKTGQRSVVQLVHRALLVRRRALAWGHSKCASSCSRRPPTEPACPRGGQPGRPKRGPRFGPIASLNRINNAAWSGLQAALISCPGKRSGQNGGRFFCSLGRRGPK